jgi:hypothetical protein
MAKTKSFSMKRFRGCSAEFTLLCDDGLTKTDGISFVTFSRLLLLTLGVNPPDGIGTELPMGKLDVPCPWLADDRLPPNIVAPP